jgi:hypothetical protein
MTMWDLRDDAIEKLKGLPETGMGFQIVEASLMGRAAPLLVFNASRAIEISSIGLEPGGDPPTILRNGLKVVDLLKSDVAQTLISAPAPRILRLLNTRIGAPPSVSAGASTNVVTALPSRLVKHVKLASNRVFYRSSAFNPDRRGDPQTGNFLAGTYAAPESEVPLAPTDFVAVGRFALPVNLPGIASLRNRSPRWNRRGLRNGRTCLRPSGRRGRSTFHERSRQRSVVSKYLNIPVE